MKLIRYNGGMVSFKLPLDWKEAKSTIYDHGEATFYRDRDNSGTLRLNVSSINADTSTDGSVTIASATNMYVQEGYPLKEEVKTLNIDDDDILIYFWDVIIPLTNGGKRIISFSYSILASQESDFSIQEELSFVRNTVLTAHYSQENII